MASTRNIPGWTALPVAVFVGMAVFLYLPDVLFSGPRGIHFIRQTDSLSFLMNYGRPSWDFFKPAIYSLREAPFDGHAVAEFPILYYMAALGRDLVGAPFTSLRSIHLSFVLIGHVLLAFTAARWSGSMITGTLFSLWMFSSSVVCYYAANYLPDAGAYGMVLTGLCLVLSGVEQHRSGFVTTGLAFLVLAALIKAPTGLYLLAILGTGFLCNWTGRSFMGRRQLMVGVIGLVLGIGWHAYAIVYNQQHNTHYFMTWAEPIWAMDHSSRQSTWGLITNYWWTKYHHPTTWHVLATLLVLGVFLVRYFSLQVRFLLTFLIIAFGAYMALFFRKFADHDYYFLSVSPIIIICSLAVISAIHKRFSTRWAKVILPLILLALSIMGMSLSKMNLDRRYAAKDDFTVANTLEHSIGPVLVKHRIAQTSKAVVLGDPTPNGALLYLDMKGWAYGSDERLPPLDSLINKGANLLLVLGNTSLDLSPYELVHQHTNWRLFRLHHQAR